jgi:uncharacterized damage-inducible protein DinB
MISIEKALRHMAWSNQLVFQEVSKLPEEIYGLKAAEGEWPVGRILTHFIGAAEWYKYCSTGVKWEDDIPIKNHQILLSEVKRLAKLDEILINQASREDEICTFEDDSSTNQVLLSVILAQAVNHTAEHKAQLSTILKMHGYHLDLDDKDVWAYESSIK